MSDKRLIVVVGPTGSGKTDLSIRLALNYDAPILSTDSRQVYRGLPIGTAQPAPEQLQAVEHHFIASHDINDNLNCGEYETQALARLGELFAAHDYVVAVGGSGLYVRALCEGMDDLRRPTKPCGGISPRGWRPKAWRGSPKSFGRSIRPITPKWTAAIPRVSSGLWRFAC